MWDKFLQEIEGSEDLNENTLNLFNKVLTKEIERVAQIEDTVLNGQ